MTTDRQVLQTRRGWTLGLTTHAVRRVTMAGAVRTVAGNVEKGFGDGTCAAARFDRPIDLVVENRLSITLRRINHSCPDVPISPGNHDCVFLLPILKKD